MSGTGALPQVQAFRLPKRGHSDAEYEDACAADAERGRFAIADGATESSFAAEWARLLVDGFVEAPTTQPGQWAQWLPPLQQRWQAQVQDRPMPWYAETKVQEGAFATFLGVVVQQGDQPRRRRWQAVAVGDSCLFQLREGRLHTMFPMTRSADFGNVPALLGSRSPLENGLPREEVRMRGNWRVHDQLWLMTDALARWFLQQVEGGHKPWEAVAPLLAPTASTDAFAAWIDELRNSQDLRNDDVTLLVVSL